MDNTLWRQLDAADAQALAPHLRPVKLHPGQVLVAKGQPVDLLIFPATALISLIEAPEDGRAVEVSSVGRETAAGLLAAVSDMPIGLRMVCQIPGEASTLPAPLYRDRLRASRPLLDVTLRHLQAAAQRAEANLVCALTHPLPARLAAWLLTTSDRVGQATFPVTQDHLAIATGTQRTTVSGIAAGLRAKGAIAYLRGHVTLTDRPALERLACGCYRPPDGA